MLLQMCYAVDNSNNRPAKDAGFAERRLFMERIIFHIDVNSAYLSWSAIDLLKKNPDSVDIRTIPAIIGGNRKTRHGIVLAKSLSAKNRYHIHTAEPVANALKKLPNPYDHSSRSRFLQPSQQAVCRLSPLPDAGNRASQCR